MNGKNTNLALKAGSWVLYDFANTIYSFAIITLILPPTMQRIFGSDLPVSIVSISSMIFAGFAVPILGVWTDRRPWAKRLLGWTTTLCVVFCIILALLLVKPLGWIAQQDDNPAGFYTLMFLVCVAAFGANILYQIGLMLYNSLLVVVAPKKHWGIISGLGVGVGYAGSLFTIALFLYAEIDYEPFAILLGALLFFVFSIPLLIFVPERSVQIEESTKKVGFLDPIKEIAQALKVLPKNKPLFLGLLGNFLCVDAVNTLILMMTAYVTNTVYDGMTSLDKPVQFLMVGLIISSIGWSLINGYLSKKLGSVGTLLFAAFMLILSIAIAVGLVKHQSLFVWSIMICGGAGISGMWIAGRKMVAELSPVEHRGLFFGLYGMTNKVGAISTLVFACLTQFLPGALHISKITSYRVALSFLFVPLTVGITLFAILKFRYLRGKETENDQ